VDLFLPPILRRLLASIRNSRAFHPVQFVFRVSYLFYKELRDDKAFIRAAGMSYTTLIALVPSLVLIFGVLGAVGLMSDPNDQQAVYDALFGTFFGDVKEIREALIPLFTEVDFRALGAVSVGALLVVAARLYLMVEQAYSDIFEVDIDRWMTRRILNFYFSMTAVPLVLVASIEAAWRMGLEGYRTPMVSVLQFSLLLGALKLFPCTQVRWGPALLGATTSWVLLELGGSGFQWYVQWTYTNPDYPLRAFYGSLILLPVFLVWLYMLWLVVLLGVEVAHVAQNYGSLVEAEQTAAERERRRLRSPSLDNALEILAHVAAHWIRGDGPVPHELLDDEMHLPSRDVREVAAVLVDAKLMVESGEGWLLCKPPESIALMDVADAWRELTSLPGGDPRIADEVERALDLDGSLADAVTRWEIAFETQLDTEERKKHDAKRPAPQDPYAAEIAGMDV
jgi:membrane protein